jgi:CspA family cold shock protein
MAKSQLTFKKKERAKKQIQKRQEKEERRMINKSQNDKGKPLEDMMAYVDEFGNISSTPPTKAYEFKASDLERPIHEGELFKVGIVSFAHPSGYYGYVRDDKTKETYYFSEQHLGIKLAMHQKVQFKSIRTPKGNQVSELELL